MENNEEDPQEDFATLYKTNVEIVMKEFVNQKNETSKQNVEVRCNDPGEFLQLIWGIVHPYIEKQLQLNTETNNYEWCHDELDQNDLSKFVIFQDKSSKRTFETEYVTKKLLKSWKTKTGIIAFIHIYGIILKMEKQYDQVFKEAIQPGAVDRAGAVNNIEIFKCIEKLKEIHSDLVASEASWMRRANWIMKQAGHERDALMTQDPPTVKPNLFELFKLARSETEHMQEVRKGVAIGKRVNEGVASAIPAIETEIEELIAVFESGLQRAKPVQNHLWCLKAQLTANDNLMDGFSESLGAKEDGFSYELLDEIDNVDDIDHQEL